MTENKRENAILGHLLFDNRMFYELADRLKPKYFQDLQNMRIMECIHELATMGRSFSALEIADRYRRKFDGESIALKLTELENSGYSMKGIEDAVKILIDSFKVSQMQKLAKAIQDNRVENPVEYALKFIDKIVNETSVSESMHIRDLAVEVGEDMQHLIELRNSGKELDTVVYSGFAELDKFTGGFQVGENIVIGARPAMGKSTLARQLAINAGKDFPVKIFTKEMTPKYITSLIGMNLAELNTKKLRTAEFNDYEFKSYSNGLGKAQKLDIEFDLITSITALEASVRAWRMKTDKSMPAVLIIDYGQQLSSSKRNTYENINEVSNRIKEIAIREHLVVFNLMQLSRAVENESDKRPNLNHLKESGNIEQDADMVLFPFRPEYYGFEIDENGDSTKGLILVDIAKNRHGPTGEVKLQFIGKYGKITNWMTGTPILSTMTGNTIQLPQSAMQKSLYGDDEILPF